MDKVLNSYEIYKLNSLKDIENDTFLWFNDYNCLYKKDNQWIYNAVNLCAESLTLEKAQNILDNYKYNIEETIEEILYTVVNSDMKKYADECLTGFSSDLIIQVLQDELEWKEDKISEIIFYFAERKFQIWGDYHHQLHIREVKNEQRKE